MNTRGEFAETRMDNSGFCATIIVAVRFGTTEQLGTDGGRRLPALVRSLGTRARREW